MWPVENRKTALPSEMGWCLRGQAAVGLQPYRQQGSFLQGSSASLCSPDTGRIQLCLTLHVLIVILTSVFDLTVRKTLSRFSLTPPYIHATLWKQTGRVTSNSSTLAATTILFDGEVLIDAIF